MLCKHSDGGCYSRVTATRLLEETVEATPLSKMDTFQTTKYSATGRKLTKLAYLCYLAYNSNNNYRSEWTDVNY